MILMKKILLCMLAVMFVIFVGGCGKDNSNSSSSNPSVSSKPTFQGIAYNEEDIKTDDYFTTFSIGTISIRSRMKSERKEFLDEYYAKNKQVTDYDKWKKNIQTLLDDTNNMIAGFNKMTPGENIKGDDLKKYNDAKTAAVNLLDIYAKFLSKSVADVQSAQNKGSSLDYKFLSDMNLTNYDYTVAYTNFIRKSGAFDNGLWCWIQNPGDTKLGFTFIPKLNIMVTPYATNYDENTNELTQTFCFLNRGMENFDMSKIKVTFVENNTTIEGDSNANNKYVKEMSDLANRSKFTFTTSGIISRQEENTKNFVLATYVFKPISRNFSTEEGKYTSYFIVSYDGQPIFYTEYLDSHWILNNVD